MSYKCKQLSEIENVSYKTEYKIASGNDLKRFDELSTVCSYKACHINVKAGSINTSLPYKICQRSGNNYKTCHTNLKSAIGNNLKRFDQLLKVSTSLPYKICHMKVETASGNTVI